MEDIGYPKHLLDYWLIGGGGGGGGEEEDNDDNWVTIKETTRQISLG